MIHEREPIIGVAEPIQALTHEGVQPIDSIAPFLRFFHVVQRIVGDVNGNQVATVQAKVSICIDRMSIYFDDDAGIQIEIHNPQFSRLHVRAATFAGDFDLPPYPAFPGLALSVWGMDAL